MGLPVGVIVERSVDMVQPEYVVITLSPTLPVDDMSELVMVFTSITDFSVWSKYVTITWLVATPEAVKPEDLISWQSKRVVPARSAYVRTIWLVTSWFES